jgi:hypothetical protein
MEFKNQHLDSGFGTLWNAERSESMRVFYVLRSSESSVGKVAWMTELNVQEINYRRNDEPDWLWKESILEADNGKRYMTIQKSVGFWAIHEIEKSK